MLKLITNPIRKRLQKAAIRVLPNGLLKTYTLWALGLAPIAGGDDPPGGGGGGGGNDDPPGGGNPPSGGDDYTPPDKAAWDNTQRQLREERERRETLEREQQERERKAAEEANDHKALYESERKAREEAEKKAADLEAQRERDREEAEQTSRRNRAEKIAGRLHFEDPEDVIHRLSDADLSSEAKTEKALKEIAEKKPYLLREGTKRGTGRVGGDGGAGGSGGGSNGGGSDEPVGVGRLAKAYESSDDK